MMKSLVKNGFTRREDLDFSDDGNRFQCYEYNGLVISKHTYKGDYYISIRVDYLNDLTYYDYSKKDWYKLTDKFNGVSEVDVDELKETMDIIAEGVKELRNEIKAEKIDWTEYDSQADKEIQALTEFIEEHKKVDILKISNEYRLKDLQRYLKGLQDHIERLKNYKKAHNRYNYQWFKEYGYIVFEGRDRSYYANQIIDIINGKEW